ncbi:MULTISPECIES: glucosamine-6-phosphate deaminase [unclassified Clostridium]|uniref:glucosamine-6-phosphate deaminase n=1 Tax=unclassified Clostridium TaxID=2614128 RepID=UPI003216379B
MNIIKAEDYESMSRKAANIISAQVILYPNSVLGLATGSTPLGVYKQLIDIYNDRELDFSKVHSVNLDEYYGLAPDHNQSYHSYMKENFFKHINMPSNNINIPNGLASNIDLECSRYDKLISDFGGIDLQLLGIGHNGHIGFNEPGEVFEKNTYKVKLNKRTIDANSRFFNSIEEVPKYAITMGIKAIMQSKGILLVVNGISKADILYEALLGAITPKVPASILQLHPNLTVIADKDALSTIEKKAKI